MKYFITGATGFIGGRLAARLAREGHEVIALVRDPAKGKQLEAHGIRLATGDIVEKESLRKPMEGVDGVFHCAAWYKIGARDTSPSEVINVGGTRNVLEVMKELGIRKGVYTSTLAVNSHTYGEVVDEAYRYNGTHLSAYDLSKWRAHYEVAEPMQRKGLPLVIVQPGLVYGPGDTSLVSQSLRQYLLGRLPIAPKGTAFCWAHVDDVVNGHILAMERGKVGENYFICGPPMTFIDAMRLCERITGRKAPRIHPGPPMMRVMANVMGIMGKAIDLPDTYSEEFLRINAGTTYFGSDAKARRDLGFTTRSLEEGLRDTLYHDMQQLGMPVPQL